jgi:hypothetical protein
LLQGACMMINQFAEEVHKRVNVGTRILLMLFMAILFIVVVPLLTSILFSNGLIPSDGLTTIFYVILVPIMGLAALVYVIWKM